MTWTQVYDPFGHWWLSALVAALPKALAGWKAATPDTTAGGGFGLAVKMHVEDKSLPQADLASLVQEAHEKICPYSHATRGNVDVELEVVGS